MPRWFNAPLKLHRRWKSQSHLSNSNKRHINGRYILLNEIGHGASGIVHLAVDVDSNTRYAIKELSKSKLERQYHSEMLRKSGPVGRRSRPSSTLSTSSESSLDDTLTTLGVTQSKRRKLNETGDRSTDIINESNILRKLLPHENIANFIEVINNDPEYPDSIFIVMEYAEKGVVMDIAPHSVSEPLSDSRCRKVFKQLAEAVDHIHKSGVVHRDIKPQNLLLSKDNTVKLIDFGNAIFVPDTISYSSTGTPAFMAPELLKKVPQSQAQCSPTSVDLWSMGVTLYCLTYGHLPFEKSSLLDLYADIQHSKVTHPTTDDVDPLLVDLINQLLVKNPHERITMEGLKSHPWMMK